MVHKQPKIISSKSYSKKRQNSAKNAQVSKYIEKFCTCKTIFSQNYERINCNVINFNSESEMDSSESTDNLDDEQLEKVAKFISHQTGEISTQAAIRLLKESNWNIEVSNKILNLHRPYDGRAKEHQFLLTQQYFC